MSINSKIDDISRDVYDTLKKQSLDRINPIFYDEPDKYFDNGHFLIQFPDSLRDLPSERIGQEYRQPSLMWYIFGGVILRSWLTENIESSEKYELMLRKDCPVYIDIIIETVRKHSRKSLILIQDELPELLLIDIETFLKLKDEKIEWLKSIASAFLKEGRSNKLKNALDKIVFNKELSFRGAVQEILNLSGLGVQGEFSYCLTCGEAINKLNTHSEPNLYCKNPAYSNPDTCRNIFRNWQKSRLGLRTQQEWEKHRLSLYSELQKLIAHKALVAFEELQNNHPILYCDRRKKLS